jgi:Ca2+-binding RTX toxin-like protein
MAIFIGTSANDTLTGTSSSDELYGLDGDDILQGGGGNDFLDGGIGADAMSGGSGNDTYEVDDVGDTVTDSSGIDAVRTTLAAYTLGANLENLVLVPTGAARTAAGNGLANIITVATGAMTVNGGAGNDTLSYAAETGGAVVVDLLTGVHGGMAADDSLTSIENLTGTAFADELRGNAGSNVLDGGLGADILEGRDGNDVYLLDDVGDSVVEMASGGTDEVRLHGFALYTLPAEVEVARQMTAGALAATGNALNNEIVGNVGADELWGGNGHDTLRGQGGNDALHGGDGHDMLVGGSGDDVMDGSTGNDVYVVDSAGDVVIELAGEGRDQILTSTSSYALGAALEDLMFNGGGSFTGTGNSLDNVIHGGGADDILIGAAGHDELVGQSGDDVLLGDDGDDLIMGGGGVDIMAGGAGSDQFRFGGYETGVGAAADRITDFTSGTDSIDLSRIDADFWTVGNQAFSFIGSAAFSGTAGELRHGFDGVDTRIQADLDGDALVDFEIVLAGAVTPVGSDFLL